MHSTRWNTALAFGVILIGSPAAAAGCWENLAANTANMAVTEKFDATIKCMAEQGREIDAFNHLFRDAVLAFNRSEEGPACPPGWSLFREAGGRFIVGAGEHNNGGLSEYPSFKDDPKDATGGVEKVTLTMRQMPRHRHGLETVLDNQPLPPPRSADRHVPIAGPFGNQYPRNFYEGANQPHDNMPPYIALYFCKKD